MSVLTRGQGLEDSYVMANEQGERSRDEPRGTIELQDGEPSDST